MHLNSKLIFKKFALNYFPSEGKVLEIGPDSIPSSYQLLAGNERLTWHSADICEGAQTFKMSDEYTLPIPNASYDVVVSGQVLEHVRKLWRFVPELARVCKPGGLVISIAPASWPYHEAPVDCWRIFPEGLNALYEDAGLDVVFSTWGSLELPEAKRRIPGRSYNELSTFGQTIYKLFGLFGFPRECAFDSISIGMKR